VQIIRVLGSISGTGKLLFEQLHKRGEQNLVTVVQALPCRKLPLALNH
jgi:hypothetical protein